MHSADISRAIIRDPLASLIGLADISKLGELSKLDGSSPGTVRLASLPSLGSAVEGVSFPYHSVPVTASISHSLRQEKIRKTSDTGVGRV
jgi:hypothetical protein